MTRQLYYEDVGMREFDTTVRSCRAREDGRYEIVLAESAFFPEGGGQNGDRGWLLSRDEQDTSGGTSSIKPDGAEGGRIQVLDTQLTGAEGDDIAVICQAAVPAGRKVHGVLDWRYRFDRMQNHSGEHIVSGIIHSRYGYDNKGFHMSPDRMTIDLSGEIPADQIPLIERRANEIVWANEKITTDVYTEEEAEGVEFRSKKQLHGIIRVVTIPGADVCACCGTHVSYTGQIGPIRIISHERFRGGSRLELMCGRWAYEYMSGVFAQNQKVSQLVSAEPLRTAEYVRHRLDEEENLKNKVVQYQYERIDREAEALKGAGPVLIFAEDFSPVLVQKLAARAMETNGGLCMALSGRDREGYRYAAGQEGGDLRQLIRDMNQELDGRGGGRPYFQQGSLNAKREDIERFIVREIGSVRIEDL